MVTKNAYIDFLWLHKMNVFTLSKNLFKAVRKQKYSPSPYQNETNGMFLV